MQLPYGNTHIGSAGSTQETLKEFKSGHAEQTIAPKLDLASFNPAVDAATYTVKAGGGGSFAIKPARTRR
jgi:hypothetical protein